MKPDYPPFMNAYGNVTKTLDKIKDAKTPERFSQDFLQTVLGMSGGSAKPFIPLAKRIGLLSPDGSPTELYHQFRNPIQSEQAMAKAIKIGYPQLYQKNEYAHALDRKQLEGLVMEATGLAKGSTTLGAIVSTFLALKKYANFELEELPASDNEPSPDGEEASPSPAEPRRATPGQPLLKTSSDLKFSYTIYLNLPDTTDPAVFNAIFKSMKDNLLQ